MCPDKIHILLPGLLGLNQSLDHRGSKKCAWHISIPLLSPFPSETLHGQCPHKAVNTPHSSFQPLSLLSLCLLMGKESHLLLLAISWPLSPPPNDRHKKMNQLSMPRGPCSAPGVSLMQDKMHLTTVTGQLPCPYTVCRNSQLK